MDGESRSLLFPSAVANYRSGGEEKGKRLCFAGGLSWDSRLANLAYLGGRFSLVQEA